jgi:hypothetical protein
MVPATQAATAPAAMESAIDPHWREVLKGLGSAEHSEREAAKKELDRASYRDRETLVRLADGVTDAEIKGRIMSRVDAIDEEVALNPPPITLEMKNALLGDVALELGKQLGAKMEAWPDSRFGPRDKWYTLTAKDTPFWEVFMALSKQHGIHLQGYNGFQMNQQEPGLPNGKIFGGMAVFPLSITRSKASNLQEREGNQVGGEMLNFGWLVAIDPRIKCQQASQPEMTEVTDDAGNVLYKRNGENRSGYWGGNSPCVWQSNTTLAIPEKIGKKIVSAKGELKLVAIVKSEKLVVSDVEKKRGKSVQVGGQTIVINQFDVGENQINFNVTRKQGAVGRIMAGLGSGDQGSVQMTFIDSAGRQLWTTTLQGSSGGGVGVNAVTPPVKIEFSVATKTKKVTLPFELKDLTLP